MANSETTSFLQKTALGILTQIDPSPHTRTTAKSHVNPSNPHTSKDPHEVLFQRIVQLYQDTFATLRKDLSLDDADTLPYHQNKLKQAQNYLLKSYQDKLLVNIACDHGDEDKILASCGIISENTKTITLRILYHLKLAPTHPLIPESGKADLLPSTLLIGTATDSPWGTTSSTTNFPHTTRKKRNLFSPDTLPCKHRPTATTHTHPLFMLPFTLLELHTQIKKLLPDKSSGPSGITNRMLQAGDAEFQSLLLLLFNGIWESHVQPTDWQLSLMQPIYKGHAKDKTDPASYRGIYLNDTLAKLFESLLLARVTTHTESNNTLTSNQLGTKPCTQTHEAIYSLLSTIQYNKYTIQKPTYVAFVDYSKVYPSVHRDRLSSILLHNGIVGHMCHHLRIRIDNIRLRVLHPHIQEHQTDSP